MAAYPASQSVDATELARCLFDESSDALLIFDPINLQIIDVNCRALKLIRLSRTQLLRSKLPVLFDAKSRKPLRNLFEFRQQTQTFHSHQAYQLLRDDGEPLRVNVMVRRLRTEPSVLGLVAVKEVGEHEVSESYQPKARASPAAAAEMPSVPRESAADDLHSGEPWLRELVNDVDAIVWEADLPTWRFTYVSQHAERILGYPVGQWLSEVDFLNNHLHDDDRERCLEFCADSPERGEDRRIEFRAIAKDGRIVWLRNIVRVVCDEHGARLRVRGVMFDVTKMQVSDGSSQAGEGKHRHSEQRWQHLISQCPVTVYACEPSGDYATTFVSESITSQTGYENHQFTGDPGFWANHIHPDDRDRIFAELSKLSEKRQVACEYRFLHKDGTYRWMHDESTILTGHDGEAVEIVGFWMDITERRLAEQSLQQSEARYRSLVEGAPICIHEIDLDGRLESMNPAGLKMVGVESESDVTGWDYLSCVDEKDRPRISSLLDRAFRGEASSFEFATNINDVRRQFSSNFIPITNQSGAVQKVMGTTEDITESRSATAELRESEEKFRVLTEESAAVVIMAQADRIVYCNAMLSVVTGYSLEEIHQLPFLDLIHADHRDLVTHRYHQRLQGQNPPQRYEFKIATKTGEARWIDFSGQLIDFKGAPAVLATWFDVTERKTAEEQLRQKESELAHVSRLSTMGEMVAGIAHEINQPLSAIANFAAASRIALDAMNSGDHSQIATWLEQVNEQAVSCGTIIRRLRDFTRKDDGHPERVELNQVVRDSVALIEATLRHQFIRIDCRLPEPGPHVMASRVQLQQVFLNLIRNACDAALASNAPRIIVIVDARDGRAIVSVEDNGPGVEQSQRPKLFEAFFTTKPDGMGMGLPISKSIVEAHGGSLRLDAGYSGGARFRMELPVADTAEAKIENT